MVQLISLVLIVAVGGVIAVFFAPSRPYGLIALAAAVSVVSAILGVDIWRMLAVADRIRRAAVALLVSKAGSQVIIVGMLALLFAGWRRVGVVLIAVGVAPVVLCHVLTRGQPPVRRHTVAT